MRSHAYGANHRIRQAIYNTRQIVRLLVHLWEKLSQKTRVIATLTQQLGRPPTQEEIAAHMSASVWSC
ncbi:sigma-70 domain-containing protein [Thermosporothrix hazakensis]|uniref:sigma-70 domain-containing protein n=1 Tax=Thermosporothrix hazakensis TaxID=644383 RepID=UPI000DAD58F8